MEMICEPNRSDPNVFLCCRNNAKYKIEMVDKHWMVSESKKDKGRMK